MYSNMNTLTTETFRKEKTLKKIIKELENKNTYLDEQCKAYTKLMNKLMKEIEQLNFSIASLKEELLTKESRITKLENLINNQAHRLEKYKESQDTSNLKLSKIRYRNLKLLEENTNNKAKIKQLKSKLLLERDSIRFLEDEILSLEKLIDEKNKKYKDTLKSVILKQQFAKQINDLQVSEPIDRELSQADHLFSSDHHVYIISNHKSTNETCEGEETERCCVENSKLYYYRRELEIYRHLASLKTSWHPFNNLIKLAI